MKLITTLIALGTLMKFVVEDDIEWIRDIVVVIILIAHVAIPMGEVYGLTVVLTMVSFTLINLIYNIRYDDYQVTKVEELYDRVREYQYMLFNLEEELRREQLTCAEYKRYKEENVVSANLIVHELYNKYREADTPPEELFNLLKEFKDTLDLPLVIERSAYDFKHECMTKHQRKRNIRRIRNIKKEYDLGMEFDIQLDEMINKLEEGLS